MLPDFSAHSLRHTFCTRLCERETNLKIIQSIMGHKDIQSTMDIYAESKGHQVKRGRIMEQNTLGARNYKLCMEYK